MPFFVSFICFFSSLSPLDIFDPLSRLLRSFQIRLVYCDSDVYRIFCLLLSRCVSSIAIFYRFPDMFPDTLCVSRFRCASHVLSIDIHMCFVYHDLLLRSRYVSSLAIFFRDPVMFRQSWWGYRYVTSVAIFFLNIDMFRLLRLVFFRDPVIFRQSWWGYRYVLSVAIFFLDLDMFRLLRSWSLRGLLDWSEVFVVF